MTLQCPDGHINPDGATFCDQCGKPLMAVPVTTADEQPTFPAMAAPPPAADETEVTQVAPASPAAEATPEATQPAPQEPPAAPAPMATPAADLEATVVAPSPAPEPAAPPAPEPVAAAPAPAPEPAAAPAPAVPAPAPAAATPAPAPAAPPPTPAAAPAPAHPRLVVQKSGTIFDLAGKTSTLIGREDAPSNSFPDIDLTPYGAEEGGVSRLHARFTQSGDQWTIEDLESTNFTFVNGKRIQPKTPTPLNDGAEIRLGRVSLRFTTSG
jgi:hypothetical protein